MLLEKADKFVFEDPKNVINSLPDLVFKNALVYCPILLTQSGCVNKGNYFWSEALISG